MCGHVGVDERPAGFCSILGCQDEARALVGFQVAFAQKNFVAPFLKQLCEGGESIAG